MSPTCDPLSNYFSSPDFLQLSLRFISILSTPIFLLGTYCILFKTPTQMNSVKYHMLTLHLIINLFDYSISVITIPYILIPQLSGVLYGSFRFFGLSLSASAMISVISLAYIFITLLGVYENRFFILCEFQFKERWKFWRRVWWAAHYIAALVFQIPIYFLIPSQETAKLILIENLPCLPKSIYNSPTILVLATDFTYHISYFLTFGITYASELFFFMGLLIRNSQKQSPTMSTKTYQMHKQFFKGLGMQLTIPVALLAIPMAYLFFAVLISYHNQTANNLCLLGITTHGPLLTIVMLIVHRPYRLAIRGLIRRKNKKPWSTIASVVFS